MRAASLLFLLNVTLHHAAAAESPALMPVGVARVDISPTNAVPLMGYAARAQLPAPTNVLQRIHARALAIGADPEVSVLLTVDNCILPGAVTTEIRNRLSRKLGIGPERIAILVTHTHSAPCLTGAAPNIFGRDIPPDDQARIDAYTAFFTDRLESAAVEALRDRRPSRLAWGRGAVQFAKNRRTAGGPVDHELPLLRVTGADGRLRAVFVSYACHCTTLSGEVNAVHGDWAGVASLALERDFPGVVALVGIGCGADSNPDPRGTLDLVNRHGETLALEAARLLSLPLTELTNAPTCRLRTLELPFQPHFTRAEWERRATNTGIVGHHARRWLARMDRGETLPPTLPYPVQAWSFGNQLAMVFLGGEVVVDYSLRLKQELKSDRIWVNAYANDVPCYIPSRRILSEGGYEAETSLWYYDRPQRLSPEIEDQIIRAVRELIPKSFEFDPREAEFPPPRPLDDALPAFRPAAGMQVELVAAEPLVESPVAIDFGADGRLWVCEMRDYPSGIDGQGKPGGRIRVLSDRDGDGRYDHAEVVATDLPFPTGLMAWGDGVLVCAAPDVWKFEPATDGSRNWVGRRLLTGFAIHNFQARVNGLRWGLDGWVYGSGGLFGGEITVVATSRTVAAQNRDFRFHPDTGEFEALAGVSQQGRVRDDFGRWFGNDNSTLIWEFPLADAYSRAHPEIPVPPARRVPASDDDIGRVYPASRTLARFNDPHTANRLTSACGPEIYRDSLLGDEVAGDVFVCEPVHNLVRRARLEPAGLGDRARRAPGEASSEFLASTDNWFRPVEVRTGPDGALWVVDFHRFVVEHPRWITPERLRELDVRAGADRGRIWKVFPQGRKPRPIRDLTRLTDVELVAVLESPNGVERDLAHRLLVRKGAGADVTPALARVASSAPAPASRAQALAVLSGRGTLALPVLESGLRDPDPRVRRVALTLAERRAEAWPVLAALPVPEDARTAFQYWLTLSTFPSPALSPVIRASAPPLEDSWLRTAWLLAAAGAPLAGVQAIDARPLTPGGGVDGALGALLGQMARDGRIEDLKAMLVRLVPAPGLPLDRRELWAAARLNLVLLRNPKAAQALAESLTPAEAALLARLGTEVESLALERAQAGEAEEFPGVLMPDAIAVLGLRASDSPDAVSRLLELLSRDRSGVVQSAVIEALRRVRRPELAADFLAGWETRSPGERSALIGLMLEREAWTQALLEALRRQTMQSAELSPVQRQQLLQHANTGIREAASAVLTSTVSDRAAVVARYARVGNLDGDTARGGETFDRLCASCHRLRGHGQDVGPDLAPFRPKPTGDFLVAILDPNAAIEPRFAAWNVELKDGQNRLGLIREEASSTLRLVEPGGGSTLIPRSEIARLTPTAHSLMPEGLEQGLSDAQLADLIAWIRSGPAVFGQAAPDVVKAARMRFRESRPARVDRLASALEPLPYPGWLGVLPLYYCRLTDGVSSVRWQVESGDPKLRFPVAMGLRSQPAGRFTLRVNGRQALDFDVTLDDAVWARPDGGVELRYRVEEANAEDSSGVLELTLGEGWRGEGHPLELEVRGSASDSQRWFGVYDFSSADGSGK